DAKSARCPPRDAVVSSVCRAQVRCLSGSRATGCRAARCRWPGSGRGSPPTGCARRSPCPSRRSLVEAVPDAADRLDPRAVLLAELRADAPDVDVDGPRATVVVVAPHAAEQRLAREDATGMGHEELEELVLH